MDISAVISKFDMDLSPNEIFIVWISIPMFLFCHPCAFSNVNVGNVYADIFAISVMRIILRTSS